MSYNYVTPPPRPDAVVDPWLQSLCEQLLSLYPLPPTLDPLDDSVLYPVNIIVMYLHVLVYRREGQFVHSLGLSQLCAIMYLFDD